MQSKVVTLDQIKVASLRQVASVRRYSRFESVSSERTFLARSRSKSAQKTFPFFLASYSTGQRSKTILSPANSTAQSFEHSVNLNSKNLPIFLQNRIETKHCSYLNLMSTLITSNVAFYGLDCPIALTHFVFEFPEIEFTHSKLGFYSSEQSCDPWIHWVSRPFLVSRFWISSEVATNNDFNFCFGMKQDEKYN